MTERASRRYAFCLFCDDVRAEVGNKLSYMGVYNKDILFPPLRPGTPLEVPVVLPKFVIVAWLISDINDRPERVKVRAYIPPGRTELATSEAVVADLFNPDNLLPGSQKYSIQVLLPSMNVPIPCSGFIEVTVEADGEELRAGRIQVIVPGRPAPVEEPIPSTASPPPSEQSLPAVPETKPAPARRRPSSRRSWRTPERE